MKALTIFCTILQLVIVFADVKGQMGTSNPANTATACPPLKKLDVLPGFGWDPLHALEMAPVMEFSYSLCKVTLNGNYILPDHVYTIPDRQSDVQLSAEIIENWSNYTSVTDKSMGVSAGVSIGSFSASGTFGSEYQTMKQKQIDEKSVTTRVTARYAVYRIGSEITTFSPEFNESMYDAIEAIETNNSAKVDFILDLVTRDYGTHVIKRIDAGALIYKDDFILRQFTDTYSSDKSKITAAASASFFGVVNFGGNYKKTTQEDIATKYTHSTTSSHIRSIGGALYKPNTTVEEWIDSIPSNLVTIDRAGDPLYMLITAKNFIGVAMKTLETLMKKLADAATRYYLQNSHKGCMEPGAPNFDFNANIPKTCAAATNNFTFGGIFQTCQNNGNMDLCGTNGLYLKNVVTEGFTCPSPYTAIPLKSGIVSSSYTRCHEDCHGWWIFGSCDTHCDTIPSQSTYTAYWCAALNGVPTNNTGMMFGGVFTSKVENPLTLAHSCPPTFFDFKILQDLHVCIGNDYELGIKFSVKFGGFFSCQNGNPLYDILKDGKLRSRKGLIKSSGQNPNDENSKTCPNGYTQHTAIIDEDCLVSYCVIADSFRVHGEMRIRLPPFQNSSVMFSAGAPILLKKAEDTNETGTGSSSTSITGIVIGSVFAIGLILVISGLVIKILQKRRQRRQYYEGIPSAEMEWDGAGTSLLANLVNANEQM